MIRRRCKKCPDCLGPYQTGTCNACGPPRDRSRAERLLAMSAVLLMAFVLFWGAVVILITIARWVSGV